MLPNNVLSIQLWSTRQSDSLAEQFEYLRACGYNDVQPHHDQYTDPPAMRALLDEYGLTARSGHFTLSMFERDLDGVVDAARILGMGLVVAPWLNPEDRPNDREGWQALGRKLATISREIRERGLGFAWHNHEFEFVALPDGSCGLEHLLGEDVDLLMDIGWVHRAEQDPLVWLERYAGRIPAVHVKDVAALGQNLDEMGFADVGEGVMDWARYWPAAVDAGAQLMIVEHDAPSDWRRFARVSAQAVRRLAGGSE